MINTKDIYWAAGFVDGEGSFNLNNGSDPRITVGQVDPEMLFKLQRLFGGKIRIEKRQYKSNARDIHLWNVNGKAAIGVMLTLYLLLSQRRQNRIREIVSVWKWNSRLRNPMYRRQSICKQGHDLTHGSENVKIEKNGTRKCWICCRAAWHRRELRRKAARLAMKLAA